MKLTEGKALFMGIGLGLIALAAGAKRSGSFAEKGAVVVKYPQRLSQIEVSGNPEANYGEVMVSHGFSWSGELHGWIKPDGTADLDQLLKDLHAAGNQIILMGPSTRWKKIIWYGYRPRTTRRRPGWGRAS